MDQPNTSQDKFQTNSVATIAQSHAVHDTYTAFLPSILPIIKENFSLSTTEVGVLTLFQQAPSLAQPIIGHIADRKSLRYLVICTPAISAILMSILGVTGNILLLILMLMAVGFSSASLHAVGPALAGELSGKKIGRGMSFWMVGGEVGRTLGPIIIVTAIKFITIENTPWLMIAGILFSVYLYIRLRNASDFRPQKRQSADSWQKSVKGMLPIMLPIACILAARGFMHVSITTFLPLYLTGRGADLWFAGASLSLLEAAGVIGALISGSVSDTIGRRPLLFISLLLAPVFMLFLIYFNGWAQWIILLLLGYTALSITPVLMAVVQENFAENRAMANGMFSAINFIIRLIAITSVGLIGDTIGLDIAFTISAILVWVGLPVLLFLPSKIISSEELESA
jgi:MFS transporter, FSR family, fosmidomycin resistance protein